MTVSQTITPFLMFQHGRPEAAMAFHGLRFADSESLDVERRGMSYIFTI
jgi:predicted 3-demethylubiquinone-9 3-methyltransferase (glyoxalase superfamily)